MYKILANTLFLGKDIHFLPDCHSTNDMALQVREAYLLPITKPVERDSVATLGKLSQGRT